MYSERSKHLLMDDISSLKNINVANEYKIEIEISIENIE